MFKIETIEVADSTKAYYAAKDLIKAQGNYRKIGSGCYGSVFGKKGSDVVYKMGDLSDNEGYLSYIKELAKLKKHNPFTPRIYGVRIYKAKRSSYGSEGGYFVVAMERLAPSKRDAGRLINWFADELETRSRAAAPAELGVKVVMPRPLKEAISVLRKAYDRCSYASWDLHGGNFMFRGEQIVVTDPLA